ncbi:WD40 repeat domain-containing protein [bacterium]|nr:MAG: WD40 repeat domain-containing protein [bacterium]
MKRRWTWGEKALFLAPLLILVGAGALWWGKKQGPQWLAAPEGMEVVNCSYSPDGKRLAAVLFGGNGASRGIIYDVASLSPVCELDKPAVSSWVLGELVWAPDGKSLALDFDDKMNLGKELSKFVQWDAANGRTIGQWHYGVPSNEWGNQLTKVKFSSDGQKVLSDRVPPVIYETSTGKPLSRFFPQKDPKPGRPNRGEWNSDGKLLALISTDNEHFEVQDTKSGRVLWQPKIEWINSAHWSRQGVLGALGNFGKRKSNLLLWDGQTRKPLPLPPSNSVGFIEFSSQNGLMALSEVSPSRKPHKLIVWNYRANRMLWAKEMRGQLHNFQWSPDGKSFLVTETDRGQRRFLIGNGQGEVIREIGTDTTSAAQWAPDSKSVAVRHGFGIEIIKVDDAFKSERSFFRQ